MTRKIHLTLTESEAELIRESIAFTLSTLMGINVVQYRTPESKRYALRRLIHYGTRALWGAHKKAGCGYPISNSLHGPSHF